MSTMDNILTTGGSIVGGLINAGANIYMQNQTNRTNREIANENNRFNREMWNLQTQYNTPANQMQRFKEAGLNTSLMYGTPQNVASTPHPADTTGKAVAPQIQMDSVIANAMQQYQQNKLIDAQVKNINLDTEIKKQKQPYEVQQSINTANQIEQNVELTKQQVLKLKEDTQQVKNLNEQYELNWFSINREIEEKYRLTKAQREQAEHQAQILFNELTNWDKKFNLFVEMSEEQIASAKAANVVAGIDATNYQKVFDEANTGNTGAILLFLKYMFSMVK